MQKIVPHLWYDTQAVEAAKWYVSIFDQANLTSAEANVANAITP